MVCTATNSSHKRSAAIRIPNKKKNANKKLATVSNVSLGILNTSPNNACMKFKMKIPRPMPLLCNTMNQFSRQGPSSGKARFWKGGINMYQGQCTFFLSSASQDSGTIETQYPFLTCAQQMLQNYREAILLCQGEVYLLYSYQILNEKEAPRIDSMTVAQPEVILTGYCFKSANRGVRGWKAKIKTFVSGFSSFFFSLTSSPLQRFFGNA